MGHELNQCRRSFRYTAQNILGTCVFGFINDLVEWSTKLLQNMWKLLNCPHVHSVEKSSRFP